MKYPRSLGVFFDEVFSVVSLSPRIGSRSWTTLSFASTLHLCHILDLLVAKVPRDCRDDVRLGLQEALVNAAKHGNHLDPGKKVLVRFSVIDQDYWWVISDEGSGFHCNPEYICPLPAEEDECGRGLYILHRVFDSVQWNQQCRELRLCKRPDSRTLLPIMSQLSSWWKRSVSPLDCE